MRGIRGQARHGDQERQIDHRAMVNTFHRRVPVRGRGEIFGRVQTHMHGLGACSECRVDESGSGFARQEGSERKRQLAEAVVHAWIGPRGGDELPRQQHDEWQEVPCRDTKR